MCLGRTLYIAALCRRISVSLPPGLHGGGGAPAWGVGWSQDLDVRLERIFRFMDADHGGTIQHSELAEFLRKYSDETADKHNHLTEVWSPCASKSLLRCIAAGCLRAVLLGIRSCVMAVLVCLELHHAGVFSCFMHARVHVTYVCVHAWEYTI